MLQKVISSFVATMLLSAVVMAGPTVESSKLFDTWVKKEAKTLDKSEEEVREEAISALRKTGKYSDEDLARIGRKEVSPFAKEQQMEMIKAVKADRTFQVKMGLDSIRREDIARTAGDAFEKVAASRNKKVAADKTGELALAERDVVMIKNAADKLGAKAVEALVKADSKTFPKLLATARKLGERADAIKDVKEREEFKGRMSQLMVDAVDAYKVPGLEDPETGGVVGEGTSKACAEMDQKAIANFAKFVRGGAIEGKDAETYIKGMGRVAAAEFKQELEDGIARVCALASSGCKLLSQAIAKSCQKMAAAHTAAL